MKIFISLLALQLALIAANANERRTWTRLDGATVEAPLADATATHAILKLPGRLYPVEISQLSLNDLRYLAEWSAKRDHSAFIADQTGPEKSAPESDEIRIEAESIENPIPGGRPTPVEPDRYIIDGDSSRGYLEVTFPNPLYESDFQIPTSLEFVFHTHEGPLASSKDRITLKHGRNVVAEQKGAGRNKEIRLKLDPEEFRHRSKIKLELRCGPDAVVLARKPAPHLIARFKSAK